MLKVFLSKPYLKVLKTALQVGRLRTDVPIHHRLRAAALGLGSRNFECLVAEVSEAHQERDVNDAVFLEYLSRLGYAGIPANALSEAIRLSMYAFSLVDGNIEIYARRPLHAGALLEGAASPEAVRQLNLSLNSGNFFGGPNDKYADIRKSFLEKVMGFDVDGEDFLRRMSEDHQQDE